MVIKSKVVFDMILNIVAAAMPVAVLQLVVYPISARALGAENYGLMLTIYSAWIMVSNSFGNALNNVRLLHNFTYEKENIRGDFNVLLKQWSLLNAVVVGCIVIFYYQRLEAVHICLSILVATVVFVKAYVEVGFRIVLNYKAIVVNNLLQSIGFLVGCYLSRITGLWEFIFLIGYLVSCIFCITKTKILRENCRTTKFYKKIKKDYIYLLLSGIVNSMMTYADKLVLYPLMGGTSVSIYYTATILGKILGMLTSPINSVILSYISKWNTKQNSLLTKIIFITLGIVICGYVLTLLIARPIIGMLFPQWIDPVMKYLPVTTITVCLQVLISILQPFVLKFCQMKWQIVINGLGVVIYFISALILWYFWGLMGFCIGTIIGAVVKLIIMLLVYYKER